MNNNRYTTLAEASTELKKRGFNANLKVSANKKLADSNNNQYTASQVKLVEFHRFEGMSNPADSTIIYAVETESGEKGTVVDSFGADGSEVTADFMNQVKHDETKK